MCIYSASLNISRRRMNLCISVYERAERGRERGDRKRGGKTNERSRSAPLKYRGGERKIFNSQARSERCNTPPPQKNKKKQKNYI